MPQYGVSLADAKSDREIVNLLNLAFVFGNFEGHPQLCKIVFNAPLQSMLRTRHPILALYP
eukprot:snap_masked-scaffold_11-processed-gene-4.8-mRNA-1 protein AED:1.00 eAED:1.00 QI:0/-1/0/0/-1/1/1/0/60